MDEMKRKYESACIEAELYKKWRREEAEKRIDAEEEIKEKTVYIEILEDENEQLRKELESLKRCLETEVKADAV